MDEPLSLWGIAAHVALLSLMAIGGGVVLLAPELHAYVVDIHHLMSGAQFAAAYAIAQAAPGPNVLYVSLIGWQIGGWFGAVLLTVATLLPTLAVALAFVKASAAHGESRFGRALKKGMAPLSIGLLLAGAWVLGAAASLDWRGLLVMAATIALSLRTQLNPVLLIAAGALAGLLGLA